MSESTPISARAGSYTCSSQLVHIFLQGLAEIIGEEETRRALELDPGGSLAPHLQAPQAGVRVHFRHVSRFQASIENQIGTRSGQGMSFRVGQAAYRCGLRKLGWAEGLSSPELRLLPPWQKIAAGARYLAGQLNAISDQDIQVEAGPDSINWIIRCCPLCWGRQAGGSICCHTAGFLHEFITWCTGGKLYRVVENECIAAGGDNCVFIISRQAME